MWILMKQQFMFMVVLKIAQNSMFWLKFSIFRVKNGLYVDLKISYIIYQATQAFRNKLTMKKSLSSEDLLHMSIKFREKTTYKFWILNKILFMILEI